jgi:hypothetical protein
MAVSENYAVAKLDSRKFPGILIQGDTFHVLIQQLKEVREMAGSSEAKEDIDNILECLVEVEGFYKKVITDAGYEIPY